GGRRTLRRPASGSHLAPRSHPGPIRAGLWVSWLPLSLPPRWPFSWCVTVRVDQFSRACLGFAVFHAPPTSRQIQLFLERISGEPTYSPLSHHGSRLPVRLPQLQALVQTPGDPTPLRSSRRASEHLQRRELHPLIEAGVHATPAPHAVRTRQAPPRARGVRYLVQ